MSGILGTIADWSREAWHRPITTAIALLIVVVMCVGWAMSDADSPYGGEE